MIAVLSVAAADRAAVGMAVMMNIGSTRPEEGVLDGHKGDEPRPEIKLPLVIDLHGMWNPLFSGALKGLNAPA